MEPGFNLPSHFRRHPHAYLHVDLLHLSPCRTPSSCSHQTIRRIDFDLPFPLHLHTSCNCSTTVRTLRRPCALCLAFLLSAFRLFPLDPKKMAASHSGPLQLETFQ